VAALITTGQNVNTIFEAIRDKLAAAT